MNVFLHCLRKRFAFCLSGLFVVAGLPWSHSAPALPPGMNRTGTNEDFSVVSKAVVRLLHDRDTARFVGTLAPRIEDWQSILSTNTTVHEPDPLKSFRTMVPRQRQALEQNARQLLATADGLHLNFAGSQLSSEVVPPRHFGSTRYPSLQGPNEEMPWAQKVEVVVTADAGATNSASGQFKIAVRNLMKFPGGWRCNEGVAWEAFPPNVADEKTRRELAIMEKAASYQGITDQQDPALRQLGQSLIGFIRARDLSVYEHKVAATADLTWAQLQKRAGQRSRRDFDDFWQVHQKEVLGAARATIQQMKDTGIELADADIQVDRASVEQLYPRGGPGTMEGLEGNHFKVELAVKSDEESKTGQSLSGDYVLAVSEITRFGDEWKCSGRVRWDKLPAGVVDDQTAASIKLENYVAEHRTLPPGTTAPDIEFVRLDDGKKMNLSELRGKVVVLDFWATWCGPCQEPMAELQTLRHAQPNWKDRVAIVPISIDDTLSIVRGHLQKRGWTNTFNVWAGKGGWQSAPAKTFRVTAVPTTYIIGPQGNIVRAGHPAGMNIGDLVNAQLNPFERLRSLFRN